MQSLKLLAATALIATTMAAPAMARNYCDTHRCYHRGPVGAAADTAGAAVGTGSGHSGSCDRNRRHNRHRTVPRSRL